MEHEPEVGLVEAHPERTGGDQRLDLVLAQRGLEADALAGLGTAGVGGDVVTGLPQGHGHVFGRGHRQDEEHEHLARRIAH